jgi:hypothetical protein
MNLMRSPWSFLAVGAPKRNLNPLVSGHAKPILVGQEEAELEKIGKDQMSPKKRGPRR